MSDGRISIIAKPPRPRPPTPGARASPTSRARSPASSGSPRNRRPAMLARRRRRSSSPAAIGAALFGLPVRTWFAQDDEIAPARAELTELEAVNADLQSEVDRLQTDDGIVEAARDEPRPDPAAGERRQTVVDLPELPDRPARRLAVRRRSSGSSPLRSRGRSRTRRRLTRPRRNVRLARSMR